MAYTIISLDLGSTVGYCVTVDGKITDSGVLPLHRKEDHVGGRFLRFNNWLIGMFEKHKVNEVFYEDVPRFESAGAAKVYCGLLSLVQMLCLAMAKRMTAIKATSVKKEFTGNGRADKIAMCKVCHKLGWTHGYAGTDIDHDEADAIALTFVILKRRGVDAKIA